MYYLAIPVIGFLATLLNKKLKDSKVVENDNLRVAIMIICTLLMVTLAFILFRK